MLCWERERKDIKIPFGHRALWVHTKWLHTGWGESEKKFMSRNEVYANILTISWNLWVADALEFILEIYIFAKMLSTNTYIHVLRKSQANTFRLFLNVSLWSWVVYLFSYMGSWIGWACREFILKWLWVVWVQQKTTAHQPINISCWLRTNDENAICSRLYTRGIRIRKSMVLCII